MAGLVAVYAAFYYFVFFDAHPDEALFLVAMVACLAIGGWTLAWLIDWFAKPKV